MAPVSPTRFRTGCGRRGSTRRAVGLLALALGLGGCGTSRQGEPTAGVTAVPADDGVLLVERGRPVLFYRSRPAPGREAWRTHYIHPLYSVAGAELTEDAPADHVHHRGVFWAWRRILVDGALVADGWVGERLELEVGAPVARQWPDGSAQVGIRAVWRARVGGSLATLVEESCTIRAYPVVAGRRKVEVELRLTGLRSGVEIAGTQDDKGYGGISLRFANAPVMRLEGDGRELRATPAGMDAGRSVAFLWPTVPPPWPARIVANCRVDGRDWTQWVLRQELSMQNCAFPGSTPVALAPGHPVLLAVTLDIG